MKKIKKDFNKLKKFFPVNQPLLKKSDLDYVHKALKSGWISSEGPNVVKFEKSFAKYIGHKYGIAVSSGTAALDIAVRVLNLKKGDEIIIPNFTIISNIIPAINLGLKIKLIDCDIKTWNIDVEKIIKAINKKTKAIIITHIYNYPSRIDVLKKIIKNKKIYLIEDAAESLGQKIYNKKCGSFGDLSTFSFYSNKQITTGEGGMITTNNKNFYKNAKNFRNLCFGKKDRFNHSDIGWNYRMTNIQASLGLSQLKRINSIIKKRHEVGKIYFDFLKNTKNVYIPEPKKSYSKNIYWVIGVVIKSKKLGFDAKKIINKLKKFNIGARPFFWPMHKQNVLRKYKFYKSKNFKNSEYISKYGFYLPSSLNLKKNEIKYICNCLKKIIT